MALTLTLDQGWDIYTDANGNIATSNGAYAIAQNAANAVRLFTNDAYFDRRKGIPHFGIELGHKEAPARSTLNNRIRKAVQAVEGVTAVEVELQYNEDNRVYGGDIYITTDDSSTVQIEL